MIFISILTAYPSFILVTLWLFPAIAPPLKPISSLPGTILGKLGLREENSLDGMRFLHMEQHVIDKESDWSGTYSIYKHHTQKLLLWL